MTKLSELKVGDRFTVEAVVLDKHNLGVDFRMIGVPDNVTPDYGRHRSSRINSGWVEVTKLPDPVRDLVKGEIITLGGSQITGEYLGKGWVWWSNEGRPHPLPASATTEFYKVLEK